MSSWEIQIQIELPESIVFVTWYSISMLNLNN